MSNDPPWYRLLWDEETFIATAVFVMWGWLLLLPAVLLAYGITRLFGGHPSTVNTAMTLMLWGAGVLVLLIGRCIGYVAGYWKRTGLAETEIGGSRWQAEREVAAVQTKGSEETTQVVREAEKLAERLGVATSQCAVCRHPSKFIYDDNRRFVYGVCEECDRLIQSNQREAVMSRYTETLALGGHWDLDRRAEMSGIAMAVASRKMKRMLHPGTASQDDDGSALPLWKGSDLDEYRP